ncbi:DUF3570 domain-containing protein [Lacihabitans soyangensis]|uniref:DUF3570 domain-containing protein n=1 Tax=Lacihabitans soyangensis TaxID=869394 RepID=A0AAE3H1D7_9BACT|nr:DUF3570 domain-containing protein [Lacihabitans soyangensis]MCP9762224.1 DUF3570 domain-containing protein [Lacihabitans soyangensis]
MKKVIISIGIYCSAFLSVNAQNKTSELKLAEAKKEKTGLKSLKIDEVNLVSSYYSQTGNNSAITGGIGTEKLWDAANSLDLKLSFIDKKQRTNSVVLDAAMDYYSSASSDMIDSRSLSSASMTDLHFYPSVSWSRKDETKHSNFGISAAYSTEWDYESFGGNISYSKSSKDNNTELSLKAGAFFDKWMAILPYELRPTSYPSGAEGDQGGIAFKNRNSYNASIGVSRVVSKRLQMMLTVEPAFQEGLLSTPFHRVYFTDNTLKVEKLPGQRAKLPMSVRANYFMGDRLIFRTFYRYYVDSWGMIAHTVSAETSYKINSFLSITPHYRFNSQTAVKYFAAYKKHALTEQYYTSDYDISDFNSAFWGAGLRIAPPGGILGNRWWNSLEVRYGHYNRTNGMVSHIISLSTKIK